MEEKEEKAEAKADTLIRSYCESFYKMSYTIHPQGIPGEAQGKSSNESWAAKQACQDYVDDVVKRDVVMTVMDGKQRLGWRTSSAKLISGAQPTHIFHRATFRRLHACMWMSRRTTRPRSMCRR